MPDLARPNLPLPAPVTTLRGWLDDLAAHDRLAIIPPGGITLRHELAAISKRLDGQKATFFRRPAVTPSRRLGPARRARLDRRRHGRDSRRHPRALQRGGRASAAVAGSRTGTGARGGARAVDLTALCRSRHITSSTAAPIQRGPVIARNPRTGAQNVAIHRCQVSGPDELGILLLPRHTLAFYEAAERRGAARDRHRHRRRSVDVARIAGDRAARFRRTDHRWRATRRAA